MLDPSSHRQTRPVILRTERLRKAFGNTVALNDVSLDVHDGEFLTFLGPSGCGKTTFIRLLAGFETPTSGKVELDGKSILERPPYKRPLGMVFQNLALFPHLSVAENIGYGLKVRGTDKNTIRKKVEDALSMVGLDGYGGRYIGQISGGQRQRVAVARAIVTEPRVLLLDEPLGALDMKIRRQMQSELKQIQKKLGTTFIFVTHDQEEALTMSDRIAVFCQGAIEQVGSPAEIYERPRTRFVAEFVGDTNFFEAQFIPGSSRMKSNNFPAAFAVEGVGVHEGQRVGLSLRPQYVVAAGHAAEKVKGVVLRTAYAGQNMRIWFDVEGRELVADWRLEGGVQAVPSAGEIVPLTWDDRHVVAVPL